MLVTTKQKMYLTMHGLVEKGETIDIPEDVINDFGKDCFEFVGNVKPKDKEPGNETQPSETEPGDKNPSTEIEPVSENETELSEPEQVDESSETETVDKAEEELTEEDSSEEKPSAKGRGRGKKKSDTTEE